MTDDLCELDSDVFWFMTRYDAFCRNFLLYLLMILTLAKTSHNVSRVTRGFQCHA